MSSMILRCPDVRQVSCPADDRTRHVHAVCVTLLLSCRNCSLRLLCCSSADHTVKAKPFIIVGIVLTMVLVALVSLAIAKCQSLSQGQCPIIANAPFHISPFYTICNTMHTVGITYDICQYRLYLLVFVRA